MMRKQLLAVFLICAYWMSAGFVVAYSAWQMGARAWEWMDQTLPDPIALGVVLAVVGVIFTLMVVRLLLPTREAQRRKLMRLLDDVGIDELGVVQRKLDDVQRQYPPEDLERAERLETLLREKRKNG
jgi:TRAP-type C4-dicarboxylate transport system permease small subunit